MSAGPVLLLDCTRVVARRLARHQPTGIDRVCDAYAAHFAPCARAVIQYRGKPRVLSSAHSQRLFAMLNASGPGFRRRFARLAPAAYAAGDRVAGNGAIYLNVSHTDFDLPAHNRWVQECGLRAVYLLHDLIPIMHPQWTTARRAARHYGRVASALRSASGIIVNSRSTAEQLAKFADEQRLAMPPVLRAPLAAAELPLDKVEPHSGHEPYFLCISTIEARKNHLLLLKVWRRLIAQLSNAAPRLVLIGKWGVHSARVRRYLADHRELAGHVTIRTNCSDLQVAAALAGARALLAPSRAEGFGLPVAEALRAGVPVIASNLPAFLEIGGAVPVFIDPTDLDGWLDAVRAFCDDCALRREQLSKLQHYRAPRWADHFSLVEPWLEKVVAAKLGDEAATGMKEMFGGALQPVRDLASAPRAA